MQSGDRVYHTDLNKYATIVGKDDTNYKIKYDGNEQVYSCKRYFLTKVEDCQE